VYCCIITLLCEWSVSVITGVAITNSSILITDNQIDDYSFVVQPFMLESIFHCASGLGPSGADRNTDVGGWYFNSVKLPVGTMCSNSVFQQVRAANNAGAISLNLCRTFTASVEGVYSCIMMNSSMMNQTMRVGVYFSGRSESLDMYPTTSSLTIFHLSTQLLQ